MAYDRGLADLMRYDLRDQPEISEKKMFGGLCFLQRGNMLCGVHKGGGMYRVGKPREAEALAIKGTRKMDFTGRPMGGFIDVEDALMAEDDLRQQLLDLALKNSLALPAK